MDREILTKLWNEGKTVKEIAQMMGKTHGATNYWLIKHGLRKKAYKHNKVDRSTLEKMAKDRIQRDVIAEHFGVSQATIQNWAKKWNIKLPKWNEWKGYPDQLTQIQEDFLIGTILGDGHIQTPEGNRSAQYYAHHGPKQKEYLNWKRELMLDFMSPAYKQEVVKDATGYHFCTGCHPLFLNWREMFYDGRQKIYTEEVANKLTPLGLAVWYMDDGTYNSGAFNICTHLYEEQAELFQEYLYQKFHLHYTKHKISKDLKGRFYLRVAKDSRRRFAKLVLPYIHSTLLYKIGESEKNLTHKRL